MQLINQSSITYYRLNTSYIQGGHDRALRPV